MNKMKTTILVHEIADSARDDISAVEARLEQRVDPLGSRYRVVDLVDRDDGSRITLHESDLAALIGILKDVGLYARTLEDESDSYYWRDEVSGLEAHCRLEEGLPRIVLNHWTEYDAQGDNMLSFSPASADRGVEVAEAMLATLLFTDMIGSDLVVSN